MLHSRIEPGDTAWHPTDILQQIELKLPIMQFPCVVIESLPVDKINSGRWADNKLILKGEWQIFKPPKQIGGRFKNLKINKKQIVLFRCIYIYIYMETKTKNINHTDPGHLRWGNG